jgi:formylglycine-generating enzyme required for sulfatase activity
MDKKPIGFMSYARTDDSHENGKLSEFRVRLSGEVRMQSGDMDFDIFQDHLHIAWGQKWEQRLDDALDSVKLLIPIITPMFFRSEACRAEVARFSLREKQLGRDDLIFPVYYVNTKELEDKAKREQDAIARVISRHQRVDWRKLRHDPLTSPDAGRMLEQMAQQIVAAMDRAGGHGLLVPSVEIIRPLPPVPSVPVIQKPAWASAIGTDAIGKWAEISVNKVVQRLRWIEPGHFLMGSPKNEAERYEDEGPQHRVTISRGLWLADTACTQELWQAVMGENPSKFDENNRGGPQRPVECVSWDMIQPFLQAVRAKLPGCQASLPTEAEWEYACRAGSKTAFSFGETISADQINFDARWPYGKVKQGVYRKCTVSVKALPANKWGLYQMHGNVREWCADGPRKYEDKAVGDPGLADALVVPGEGGAARALRGGGWSDGARSARSACRNHHLQPDWPLVFTGFRLAFRP